MILQHYDVFFRPSPMANYPDCDFPTPERTVMPTKREQLIAERQKLHDRDKARRKAAQADQERLWKIDDELRRCDFLDIVGVPGGVELNRRYEDSKLNGLTGTIQKVNRTRASVDFGIVEGKPGTWNVPLEMLRKTLPKDEAEFLDDLSDIASAAFG